jgi:hypothetical protein
MTHVGQRLLAQESGESGGALGRTGVTQAAGLAGGGHKELGTARCATHAGEAVAQDAATQVSTNNRGGDTPPA